MWFIFCTFLTLKLSIYVLSILIFPLVSSGMFCVYVYVNVSIHEKENIILVKKFSSLFFSFSMCNTTTTLSRIRLLVLLIFVEIHEGNFCAPSITFYVLGEFFTKGKKSRLWVIQYSSLIFKAITSTTTFEPSSNLLASEYINLPSSSLT